MIAVLDNFDFDVKCFITEFRITRNSLTEERLAATNFGGSYDSESERLVQLAAPKDIYTFTNVRAKCPGDKVSRTLSSLVFEIQ